IGVTPLVEVWRDSSDLNRLRRRGEIELTEFAMCRGCPYVADCTGNCPALAYAITGRLDHPSPEGCLRHFVAGGGTLPAGAGPPGRPPEVGGSATAAAPAGGHGPAPRSKGGTR
ncbi:MAG: hypothetical protein ACE5EL_06140, partial [Anaerolineae bacterium]